MVDLALTSLAKLTLDLVGLRTANLANRAEFEWILLGKASL